MLRVKIGNLSLGISFQRETVLTESTTFKHSPTYEVRATYCNLHRLTVDGKTDAIIARAYAKADSRDSFNLEAGRKLALTRAMRQLPAILNKDARTVVWGAYLDRPRPVSKPKAPVKVQPAEEAIKVIMEGSPSSLTMPDGFRDPVAVAIHRLDLNAGEVH